MPGYAEIKNALDELGLQNKPVIVHASLKKFGFINGGPGTVIAALARSFKSVIMPTHTYKTMIIPEVGPPNNGIIYGANKDNNRMAEAFTISMLPDPMMGKLPLAMLQERDSFRTSHPILSFGGLNSKDILLTQTLYDPLAPIRELTEQDGWVILINVDHTVNTSIHYGEKLAGRRQFVRWALTKGRIVECPGFPGDSSGFNAIEEYIHSRTLRVNMDKDAFILAVPLKRLIEVTVDLIKREPLALLCQRSECERCNALRN